MASWLPPVHFNSVLVRQILLCLCSNFSRGSISPQEKAALAVAWKTLHHAPLTLAASSTISYHAPTALVTFCSMNRHQLGEGTRGGQNNGPQRWLSPNLRNLCICCLIRPLAFWALLIWLRFGGWGDSLGLSG